MTPTVVSVFADSLPEERLKELGVTEHEISMTRELNGNNGHDDVFIIYRKDESSKQVRFDIFESDTLLAMVPWGHMGRTGTDVFEIFDDRVFFVTSAPMLMGVRDVNIVVYHRPDKEVISSIRAETPCWDINDCPWINEENTTLVFIPAPFDNNDLKHNVVYQYDWTLNEFSEVYKSSGVVDAYNRRVDLKGLHFDSTEKRFYYSQ